MKYIIFGAGEGGINVKKNMSKNYGPDFVVSCFCDNDIKKHGKYIENILIVNPRDIFNIEFDEIIISSVYFREIKKQLLSMGVDEKSINIASVDLYSDFVMGTGNSRKLAEELICNISRILINNNIHHFVDAGTLLGIIRDKELLPWDGDIDIAISSEDYKQVFQLLSHYFASYKSKYCQNNKWSCELVYSELDFDGLIKSEPVSILLKNNVYDDISRTLHVDLILKYKTKNVVDWYGGGCKFSTAIELYKNIKLISYKSCKVSIPQLTDEYLTHLYGDFMTPIKEWTNDKYNNISGLPKP